MPAVCLLSQSSHAEQLVVGQLLLGLCLVWLLRVIGPEYTRVEILFIYASNRITTMDYEDTGSNFKYCI